jgi:hypothetical protein
MKLDQLKKIVAEGKPNSYYFQGEGFDLDVELFNAMCANFEALLEVAEAAQRVSEGFYAHLTEDWEYELLAPMREALEKLEQIGFKK